ncbi:polysaccharide deacetylase family protein [Actinospica sp. MGRD01-02]|uniref:Polysaccharide deacetylase family protein n=1 Tax=Actinospica acidithermotolerans TaxID=2828514 RepID=A0A941E8C3_9ACTN|nr:polysaccharide deacetylase family protein [Actinospica acidithermotolerans]MBR7825355.1 polysaccharide deacetylase family protein [Actinospica acidithermotolerans]
MNPELKALLAGCYGRWDGWHGSDRVLRGSPVQAWFRRRAARRLAVLGYHGIDDPAGFADHLDRVQRGFQPVSLHEVEEAVNGGPALPPHSVLITFDDGDRSVHTHALPLLAERGLPAVCFVIPGLIGTDTPYWWDEVEHLARHGGTTRLVPPAPPGILVHTVKLLPEKDRQRALQELRGTATVPAPRRAQLTAAELRELEVGGITVGNHTLTHPCLDRCEPSQARAEVLHAHEALTDMLGRPPTSFAYPNGNEDEHAHRAIKEAGYRSAFLYNHRLAAPGSCHPLRIDRLVVSSRTSTDRLETIMSGLHPTVFHSLRSAARAAAPAFHLINRRF